MPKFGWLTESSAFSLTLVKCTVLGNKTYPMLVQQLEALSTKSFNCSSLVSERVSEWIFSIFYKLNHTTPMKLRPNKEKFSVELFQNLPHQTSSQKLTLHYFAVPPFLWWLQIRRSLLILFFISMKVCGFLMCFAAVLTTLM